MTRIAAIASLTSATSAGGWFYYPLTNTSSDPTYTTWRDTLEYTFVPNDGIYTSKPITSMFQMFRDNATFNDPDISSWDVSNVTDMAQMFFSADAFNQDVSSWDVSNVLYMNAMFYSTVANTNVFNNGGVALNWGNKTANVQNMKNMFYSADAFNQDISTWNVSSVTDMTAMFRNNGAFNQNISGWVVNSVTTATAFSLGATQKGTLAANWQSSEHPSNAGLGNFYSL